MAAQGITGDLDTNGVLQVGQPLQGSLDTLGQRNWYRVRLTAGESYYFALEGGTTGQGTLRDPLLYLYDASGQSLAQNDDSGGLINSRLTYTAIRGGDYFLAAAAYDDAQAGSYQLTAGGYADDLSTLATGRLSVGAAQAGNLEVLADLDWFRVELQAGTRYRLAAQGLDTGQGTLKDPYLFVYDSDGKVLASADDGGVRRDSLLDFTPNADGTYYLAVGAYQDASFGTYQVSVSQADESSPGGQAKATVITVGQPQTGEIASPDAQDRYAVELTAGQTYCFDLEGRSSGQGFLYDPRLRLYDTSGGLITYDDDGGLGLNSRLFFTPVLSGTYYLGAAGVNDLQLGSYSLGAHAVPGEGYGPMWGQAPLSAFGARQGELTSSGQHDWVALALEAANTYLITMETAAGDGGLANPQMLLYASDGQALGQGQADASGHGVSLHVSPSQSGIYYVDAGASGENDLGRYLLSIVGRQVEQFTQARPDADWSLTNPLQDQATRGAALLAAAPATLAASGQESHQAQAPLAAQGPS